MKRTHEKYKLLVGKLCVSYLHKNLIFRFFQSFKPSQHTDISRFLTCIRVLWKTKAEFDITRKCVVIVEWINLAQNKASLFQRGRIVHFYHRALIISYSSRFGGFCVYLKLVSFVQPRVHTESLYTPGNSTLMTWEKKWHKYWFSVTRVTCLRNNSTGAATCNTFHSRPSWICWLCI